MAITYRHLEERSGEMRLTGRRIRVYDIMTMHEEGDTPEYISGNFELPLGAVYEALAYAADHPDEMEAIRREEYALTLEHLKKLPKEILRGGDLPEELRHDLHLIG